MSSFLIYSFYKSLEPQYSYLFSDTKTKDKIENIKEYNSYDAYCSYKVKIGFNEFYSISDCKGVCKQLLNKFRYYTFILKLILLKFIF